MEWPHPGAVAVERIGSRRSTPRSHLPRSRDAARSQQCRENRLAIVDGNVKRRSSCFKAGEKSVAESVVESSFLHLFFLNCEKYRERNFLVKMLFDLRKLVCAK